jgi:hypothetical protein
VAWLPHLECLFVCHLAIDRIKGAGAILGVLSSSYLMGGSRFMVRKGKIVC